MNQLLTIGRLAWIFDVSERTIREWIARGYIASVKVGDQVVRIEEKAVEDFLDRNRRAARALKRTVMSEEEARGSLERLVNVTVASAFAAREMGRLTAENAEEQKAA